LDDEKQKVLKQKVVDRVIREVYVKVMVVFNKLIQHKNASINNDNCKFNVLKKIIMFNIKPLSKAMRI